MKTFLRPLFYAFLLFSALSVQAESLRFPPINPRVPPVDPRIPRPGRLPIPDLRCAIDPAVTAIDFSILRKTSTYRGYVRITGTVKNLGRNSFISRPGQQAIYLYEDSRIVARKEFVVMNSGAIETVSFERNWDASSPAEGEFPPKYKVMISYDPDIFIDGNDKNDDCTQKNNLLERSGRELNKLF